MTTRIRIRPDDIHKPRLSLGERSIIMLPQVRGDYVDGQECSGAVLREGRELIAELQPLIDSINEHGLFHPPIFAAWTREGFESYLSLLNRVLHLSQPLNADHYQPNYQAAGERIYLALLAGHRRVLAHRRSTRSREKIECPVYFGLSAEDALSIQLAENKTQRTPRGPRELMVIAGLYEVLTKTVPMSHRVFAARIGATEEAVSGALKFMALPPIVREIIFAQEDGRSRTLVSIGNIVSLYRLFQSLVTRRGYEPDGDDAADRLDAIGKEMVPTAVKAAQSESSFRMVVDQTLQEIAGQTSLELELASDGVSPTERYLSARMHISLREAQGFLRFLHRLIRLGVVGELAPFRTAEARRITVDLAGFWGAYDDLITEVLKRAGEPSLARLIANGERFVELVNGKEGNDD